MPFALSVEERAPLSIAVARRLREAIVSGQMELGMELPSEGDLARDLGVGRSTVREALRILQAQGLLSGGDTVSTQRPRVSAEQTLSMAASTMENALRLGQVPLDDLIDLRLVLEGAAVEKAATEPGERPGLQDAREAVEAMKAPQIDVESFRAADLRFHRCLAAASGNVAFGLVMGVLRAAILGHLGEALHRDTDPRRTMTRLAREHEAILDAVLQHQGALAQSLMSEHILEFYGDLLC
jgi:GntR family transcriptional repressor for pyruvate dehydrogenase complex